MSLMCRMSWFWIWRVCCCWLALRPRQRDALWVSRETAGLWVSLGAWRRLLLACIDMCLSLCIAPSHWPLLKRRKQHRRQTGNAKESIISFSAHSYIQTHTRIVLNIMQGIFNECNSGLVWTCSENMNNSEPQETTKYDLPQRFGFVYLLWHYVCVALKINVTKSECQCIRNKISKTLHLLCMYICVCVMQCSIHRSDSSLHVPKNYVDT